MRTTRKGVNDIMGKHEKRGQSTLEYVLVFAVICAALIAALGTGALRNGIGTIFTSLGSWLSAAAAKLPTTIP